MITKVKLKNWKSHDRTELELGEGTNVLVGIMGSGKSAVLDAITYGLFGTIPSVKNRKITLDDLIKKKPIKKDSAEVEIEFKTPEGDGYMVKRVLERGKGTTYAELREADGTLINKPKATAVTEDVTSLLQMDYDFFERMIYAEQNQLDRFLTLEPRKRRKKVDELLKINKFEEARKNSTTLINRLKDRKSDRESDLRELKEDEEIEELPKLEEELEKSKKEKRELKEKKEDIRPVLQELENELKELEEIGKDIEQISKKIESRKGKIEALDNQIAKAEERLGEEISIEELKEKAESIKNSLQEKKEKTEELEEKKSSITAKISELETEKRRLKKDIAALEDSIEDKEKQKEELETLDLGKLSEQIDELEEEREALREKNSELRAEINNLKDSLEEIKDAGSTCPVCDRPLPDEVKEELIRDRSERIEDLKSRISDVRGDLDSVKEEITEKKDLEERTREIKMYLEDLPELKSKISKQESNLEEKRKELNKISEKEERVNGMLENERKDLEKYRSKYDEIKNKINLKKELNDAREEKEDVEASKNELLGELKSKKKKYDEEKIEEIKRRKNKLMKEEEHYKTRLEEIKKLIAQKEKRLESIRKKKYALVRKEAEVKALEENINSLNKIKTALSKSQTSLRSRIIEAVNSMMNDMWVDVYPYDDFQKIRLSIEERRKVSDYELQVMDSSGSWVSVDGITSGGERTCASLTLRIAFAVVLSPGLSWLVLDEPTHNLDSEGIDTLADVLRERVPRIVKQLLLITHEKRLESAVSGYLYRFHRDKSRDGPTEIEKVYESEY